MQSRMRRGDVVEAGSLGVAQVLGLLPKRPTRFVEDLALTTSSLVAMTPNFAHLVPGVATHLVEGIATPVGSDQGAVLVSQQARLPSPSPEPDLRLPPHPALHRIMPLNYLTSPCVPTHGEGIAAPR